MKHILTCAVALMPVLSSAQYSDSATKAHLYKAGVQMANFSTISTVGTGASLAGLAIMIGGTNVNTSFGTTNKTTKQGLIVGGAIVCLAGLITTVVAHNHMSSAAVHLINSGVSVDLPKKYKKTPTR